MGYKSAIELIEQKCEDAKSNLYFVIATDKEFNADDNRDYPLVWVRKPITSTKVKNANNIVVQETFSFELHVLQKCGFTDTTETEENVEKWFQDTNYILIALLNELLENDYVLTTGTATQVYKKTDLVTIGWRIPITLTIDIDNDLCCAFFN